MNPSPRSSAHVVTLLPFLVAATLQGGLLAQSPQATQDLLITCAALVVAPDTAITPGVMLVRDGKVAQLGNEIPEEARARAKVCAFDGATIVPGFVLAHSTLGQEQDLAERAVALTPDLLAAEAFDPAGLVLRHLPEHGFTSCVLSPSSTNVAGGIAALVEPGRVDARSLGSLRIAETYAKFSLIAAARNPERQPTSLMGAMDLLRNAFLDAKTGQLTGREGAAFTAVARGERRAVVHADTRAEILAALTLAKELGIEPVIAGAAEACDCVAELAAARAAVILPPLQPEQRDEQLMLPARLEQAAILFCFAGSPALARSSAALAVQNGCSKKAALAALTRTPAALCAAETTHGSLRRGCDADFVVFDGDPLDLSSQQLAVYGDGVLLFGTAGTSTDKLADKRASLQKETL
ncbi:MAG: amidohydrolase family protein [Planctomycetota bacterium]